MRAVQALFLVAFVRCFWCLVAHKAKALYQVCRNRAAQYCCEAASAPLPSCLRAFLFSSPGLDAIGSAALLASLVMSLSDKQTLQASRLQCESLSSALSRPVALHSPQTTSGWSPGMAKPSFPLGFERKMSGLGAKFGFSLGK